MSVYAQVRPNYKKSKRVETHQHPDFQDGLRGTLLFDVGEDEIATVLFDGKLCEVDVHIRYLGIVKDEPKTPMTAEQKKYFMLGMLFGKAHGLADELGVDINAASKILVGELERTK
jgi:hypothetical protein